MCFIRSDINYRIARGSKFSQIAIFEDFVEIISQIRCTHTLHATCQKFSLKYFQKQFKTREVHAIKDLQKFSAIQYICAEWKGLEVRPKNLITNTSNPSISCKLQKCPSIFSQ